MLLCILVPFLGGCGSPLINFEEYQDPVKIVQKDISVKRSNGKRFYIAEASTVYQENEYLLISVDHLPSFVPRSPTKLIDMTQIAKDVGGQNVTVKAKDSSGKMQKFKATLLVNQLHTNTTGNVAQSYALTLPPKYVDAVVDGKSFVYYELAQFQQKGARTYAWILWSD